MPKNLIFLLFFIISNNVFLFLIEEELATPPLDGIILPGITRRSILELTRKWVTDTHRVQMCIFLKENEISCVKFHVICEVGLISVAACLTLYINNSSTTDADDISQRLQCMNTFSKDCCSVFFRVSLK